MRRLQFERGEFRYMNDKVLGAMLVVLLLAIVGCESINEIDTGGVEVNGLSAGATATIQIVPTARPTVTATAIPIEPTAKAEPQDSQQGDAPEFANPEATVSAVDTPTVALATVDTNPTTTASSPTATPHAVPTTPPPTATPVPTPTTEPVENIVWITALKAVEIASIARPGTVINVSGQTTSRVGQRNIGDTLNAFGSPGAGYSLSWEVTINDGDQKYLCVVLGDIATCNTSPGTSTGDISGANVDSTAVFEIWEGNPDWNELLNNNDASIMLNLYGTDEEPSALIWQASITVDGNPIDLRGGSFKWTLESGETSFTTYKPG